MKKNRVIALILCLVMMALTLSACGQKDAAAQPGLDLEGKTADELFEMENNILGENTALWDKVFMSMSKNVTSDILNGNYGEFLISAVESAKDQFTAEEYALLKADAEKVRDIENKMSELDNAGEGGTENSSGLQIRDSPVQVWVAPPKEVTQQRGFFSLLGKIGRQFNLNFYSLIEGL